MANETNVALDTLKKIMQSTGWSQADTANKLGVSAKTLGFWLNGRVTPSTKNIETIQNFCSRYLKNSQPHPKTSSKNEQTIAKSSEEFTTSILKGILVEAQSGKELDERDKLDKDRHRDYYNGKVIALTLEDKNNSRLILFPSLAGTTDEWYKMGGQSALFYKYVIGPRLKKKPVIRNDNDLRHRFKHGIVSVHWGEKFIEDVATIGLVAKRIDYGIIIVDLERSYSTKEINEMRQREQTDQAKVKKMVTPKENLPDLYGLIRQLSQILPPKIKKMDGAYRETFGNTMLDSLMNLNKIYFRMANGHLSRATARDEMLCQIDDITALLAIIDENALFDLVTRTRIGETLVDLKTIIAKRLGENRVERTQI